MPYSLKKLDSFGHKSSREMLHMNHARVALLPFIFPSTAAQVVTSFFFSFFVPVRMCKGKIVN